MTKNQCRKVQKPYIFCFIYIKPGAYLYGKPNFCILTCHAFLTRPDVISLQVSDQTVVSRSFFRHTATVSLPSGVECGPGRNEEQEEKAVKKKELRLARGGGKTGGAEQSHYFIFDKVCTSPVAKYVLRST